jgi:hypothetical protein
MNSPDRRTVVLLFCLRYRRDGGTCDRIEELAAARRDLSVSRCSSDGLCKGG